MFVLQILYLSRDIVACSVLVVLLNTSNIQIHVILFFFQAEDGIRDLVRSRGLGDVYKRQVRGEAKVGPEGATGVEDAHAVHSHSKTNTGRRKSCLLYTSDAADERSSVDLGGRRIIKKKTTAENRSRVRDCSINKSDHRFDYHKSRHQ